MSTYIVITSIFRPTEAVRRYADLPGYQLVVAGDRKTPPDWSCANAVFLAADHSAGVGESLHKVLPFNHYCRKMLGYLYAMGHGATSIVDTDDDNIPGANYGFPALEDTFAMIPADRGFINIYAYFTEQKIWPRGLPLRHISSRPEFLDDIGSGAARIGIWQGLADEDPDVDAIYRLTSDVPCRFNAIKPVVLERGTLAPLNSQNTLFRQELFPLLYLPSHVTFRFTDILRGLIAQPISWLYGYRVGFTESTVVQKRNPHDYFSDFISEIPMYQHCEAVPDIVGGAIRGSWTISDNLYEAYRALHRHQIVNDAELEVLEAWLKDVAACGGAPTAGGSH
jgi:hypothetical protein